MARLKRDAYFLNIAQAVSKRSKDQSTKLVVVIVDTDDLIRSTGYNCFPRGLDDEEHPERQERPEKYKWFSHAERNAITNAARVGVSTLGCTMYIESIPCVDCANAIIQAGIDTIIIEEVGAVDKWVSRKEWVDSIYTGLLMLTESGVAVYEKDQGKEVNKDLIGRIEEIRKTDESC